MGTNIGMQLPVKVYILMIIGLGLAFASFSCQEKRFPSGRDTFESFGDGRFQIGTVADNILVLDDAKTRTTIVYGVKDYTKAGDRVFVLGTDGTYTILDFITGEYHHYRTISEAPQDTKKRLSKLSRNWYIEFKKKWKIGN